MSEELPRARGGEMRLLKLAMWVCEACCKGEGEQCHTPGCIFIRQRPPECLDLEQCITLGYEVYADDIDPEEGGVMGREELEKWIEERVVSAPYINNKRKSMISVDDVRALYEDLTRWIPAVEVSYCPLIEIYDLKKKMEEECS